MPIGDCQGEDTEIFVSSTRPRRSFPRLDVPDVGRYSKKRTFVTSSQTDATRYRTPFKHLEVPITYGPLKCSLKSHLADGEVASDYRLTRQCADKA